MGLRYLCLCTTHGGVILVCELELGYVQSLCKIIENPNKRVTENLYMLQPALIKDSYIRVFVLLDDCKLLVNDSFDMWKLLRAMKQNNLTVISPLVRVAPYFL